MRVVRPFSGEESIRVMLKALNLKNPKYGILLLLGIETGCRISDLLRLRVRHIKKCLTIKEQKTGKLRTITLTDTLIAIVKAYARAEGLKARHYVVFRSERQKDVHLSRGQAYTVLHCTALECGLTNIGTHSMRKTFAHLVFDATGNKIAVKKALKHDRISTTFHYV